MSTSIVEKTQVSVNHFEELKAAIESREAHVGIIGLGYVGLPLALTLNECGFDVTGIDIDTNRVNALDLGHSYVTDVSDNQLQTALIEGRFRATSDPAEVSSLDTISICVPTPLRKTKDPDMSYVIAAAHAVAERLRAGQLVIMESSTYPGTTDELVLPILQSTGLKVGQDFFLAYSPERVDPGNTEFATSDIPKVIGGVTPKCVELATALYASAIKTIVPVSSTRVAEMVKLLENTFRSVNIALVNEISLMCSHMNLNVWEVIHAASSKPFGFMPFYPGPGLGGHCMPVDPLYLERKNRIDGFESRFIELADRINGDMPRMVVKRAIELLNRNGRAMNGSRVHVLGVTYKRDISDSRESPAVEVIKLLLGLGANVAYSDPFVRVLNVDGQRLDSVVPSREAMSACDIAIILTDHTVFDYVEIVRNAPLVFDTRNATDGLKARNLMRL
jgi:UDP-N-acetyl-D-glucosamine dehydrogenase